MRNSIFSISIAALIFAVSLTAATAHADWACSNGEIYFNIQMNPGTQDGTAEIAHFVTVGRGRRGVPLPESLWGPAAVHVSEEGTHLRVEGNGFLALLKLSAMSEGYTAFLQAPTSGGGISFDPSRAYFCR